MRSVSSSAVRTVSRNAQDITSVPDKLFGTNLGARVRRTESKALDKLDDFGRPRRKEEKDDDGYESDEWQPKRSMPTTTPISNYYPDARAQSNRCSSCTHNTTRRMFKDTVVADIVDGRIVSTSELQSVRGVPLCGRVSGPVRAMLIRQCASKRSDLTWMNGPRIRQPTSPVQSRSKSQTRFNDETESLNTDLATKKPSEFVKVTYPGDKGPGGKKDRGRPRDPRGGSPR